MKNSKNILNALGKKVKSEDGFWEYVATVAIILVIIAFIAMPEIRDFATGVFTQMGTWWTSISTNIFQSS